ncbi:MAG: response regulator [Candidatus Korobacteraceae bacterium]|jgi:DNA-binding NtrC family response regulator
MSLLQTNLLIAEDDSSVRTSLAQVFAALGYLVRTADNGFAALAEMHEEVPDILLSDLNMPGMSGFDLLAVVSRKFPGVRAIAMSGAFSGDSIPCGVIADAFYEKGSSLAALMRAIETPHSRIPTGGQRPGVHQKACHVDAGPSTVR